jgi:hypothetical protein
MLKVKFETDEGIVKSVGFVVSSMSDGDWKQLCRTVLKDD